MTTPFSATSNFPNDPPKKRRTGWWIAFIVALLVAMCIVGLFISALAATKPQASKAIELPTTSQTFAPSQPITEQSNALRTAKLYLEHQSFSRKGLIDQLKFEGYGEKDATAAVDSLRIDWNDQAVKVAKRYLEGKLAFSKKGLIEQLEYEGFSHAQAVHGVSQTGL